MCSPWISSSSPSIVPPAPIVVFNCDSRAGKSFPSAVSPRITVTDLPFFRFSIASLAVCWLGGIDVLAGGSGGDRHPKSHPPPPSPHGGGVKGGAFPNTHPH